MNTPESLDSVFSDLVRRGLPAEYAGRTASELKDHRADLAEELQAAGMSEAEANAEAACRLGPPRMLVEKTVREYRSRYWCARWPLVTFLFGPAAALVSLWVVTAVLFLGVMYGLGYAGFEGDYLVKTCDGVISTSEYAVMFATKMWMFFALPALVTTVFARSAFRAAMDWRWIAVSACLFALVVGSLYYGFVGDTMKANLAADRVILGIACPGLGGWENGLRHVWNWYARDLYQVLQSLAPLALAAWLIIRHELAARRLAQSYSRAC
jgi:hypothetical protein